MRHRSSIALLTCITVVGVSSCGYRRLGNGKRGAGEICASAFECESGVCGGRCCRVDAGPCTCDQPSAANLIQNPGFDTGPASGWKIDLNNGLVSMAAEDATSCPWSGSVFMTNFPPNAFARIWQCVPVSPSTTYNFGARFHSSEGGWLHCDLDLYPMADCQGTNTTVAQLAWVNQAWSTSEQSLSVETMPITMSAIVSCYPDPDVAGNFDMIYLSPAPGRY